MRFVLENLLFVSGGFITLLLFNAYWADAPTWRLLFMCLLFMDETAKVDACLVTTWHTTRGDKADACTNLIHSIKSGATISFCIDEYMTGRIVQKALIGFSNVLELA